jgi:hypothetical protein
MQTVSREMTGAIAGVTIDAKASAAALNQTIRAAIAPAGTMEDFTPAMAIPETGGSTITYVDMTLSKSKVVPIPLSGEEELSLGMETGNTVLEQRIAQAIRAIVNQVETDLCTEAYKNASRAVGTAGITPFASTLNIAASLEQILNDNGAPGRNDPMYRTMVVSSSAGVNLKSLANLNTVYSAGSDATLRRSILLPMFGFQPYESAGVVSHVKGTATGGLINNAATEAIGQTTLTLDTITAGGTGYKAGDIITHASDTTNKYVVNTGLVAASGDIVIGNPGLKIAAADNDAVTVGNNYTANFGFSRNALALATRRPARPSGGDLAVDIVEVKDPITGITFSIAHYKGYGASRLQVELVWGYKAIQSEHIAILLG